MHRGGADTLNTSAGRDARAVVRVHCAEVPDCLSDRTIARWLRTLPKTKALALARRLSHGKGLESLTVLALLAGLAAACGLPSLDRLRWMPGGRPYFREGPSFSLAHSKGFAACGIAPPGLEIGVDLEPTGRARSDAVRLIADEAERRALDAGSITPTEFWTAKESVLKAAGAGLADISKVTVRGRGARLAGVDYEWRHFQARPGLLLAVAANGPLPPVRIVWPRPAAIFG